MVSAIRVDVDLSMEEGKFIPLILMSLLVGLMWQLVVLYGHHHSHNIHQFI